MPTQTSPPYTPYTVSPQLLARPEFHKACTERDFGEIFRLMRKYDGASQDRICSPVEGLTQSRVSRIMRGVDHISGLGVIERIADALHIPGELLGIAQRTWEAPETQSAEETESTPSAGQVVSQGPALSVFPIAGEINEQVLDVEVDVAEDGTVKLRYLHELLNMSSTRYTRLNRQFWFKHTTGPLVIEPLAAGDRNVLIQRLHDVGIQVKFGCQIFPAIEPGDSALIGYTCTGGRFVDELYWRQAIWRPTKELRLRLRLRGDRMLTGCSAVEERQDGSEVTATESLTWHRDDDGIVIDVTRYDLRPNQTVTLRWDLARATA